MVDAFAVNVGKPPLDEPVVLASLARSLINVGNWLAMRQAEDELRRAR